MWLREFREIKILCDKEQKQAEKLWASVESVWNNNFIESLDEHGCQRWEKMLKLQVKDSYTLEDRRNNIAARNAERRPYTYRGLLRILDAMCGKDGYTSDLETSTYTLIIKVQLTSKNMLSDVNDLLDRIVPANMVLDVDLAYNVYAFLNAYTYEQLEAYTYQQLREEVM